MSVIKTGKSFTASSKFFVMDESIIESGKTVYITGEKSIEIVNSEIKAGHEIYLNTLHLDCSFSKLEALKIYLPAAVNFENDDCQLVGEIIEYTYRPEAEL